jgi:hypothetical protein
VGLSDRFALFFAVARRGESEAVVAQMITLDY